MDHKTFEEADRILDEALELPPLKRLAFVEEQCGGNDELERLVQHLLANSDDGGRSTEALGGAPRFATGGGLRLGSDAVETLLGEGPGTLALDRGDSIGRYKILRQIGAGGMAVVYLARRSDEDAFEQEVAVKVLKSRTDTAAGQRLARRMERERQILASARHPNLATVIDGGSTTDGRPFLVLEYVEGRQLDRYCDEERLPVDARLRLFLQVVEGVAYAHRRLLIHRDIKPSNILADNEGKVKLLDFGIAKPVAEPSDSQLTADRARAMTPAWASPEQLMGEVITTASDIYQLGLLLYLLLAGRTAFDLKDTGDLAALVERISDAGISPPSSVVTSAQATLRQVSKSRLEARLRGDLDSIVLKSLRREPEQRYSSAGALIDDIERFLDGRPVSARRDTFFYRTGKLARRHWLAAISLVALVTLAVAYGATATVQARRLSAERDRANQEARYAESTLDFLTDAFSELDPNEARGAALTAPEVLRRAAAGIEDRFGDDPLTMAKLEVTLGQLFQSLGLFDEADPLLRSASEIYEQTYGLNHLDALSSISILGTLRFEQGRFDEAKTLLTRSLNGKRELLPKDSQPVLNDLGNLASIELLTGSFEAAHDSLTELREVLLQSQGPEAIATLNVTNNLIVAAGRLGHDEEALELTGELYQARQEAQGEDHPQTLGAAFNLAVLLARLGQLDEAAQLHQDVLASRLRVLGENHPDTLHSFSSVAGSAATQGDLERAIDLYQQALDRANSALGDQHVDTLSLKFNFAEVLLDARRPVEAKPLLEDSKRGFVAVGGLQHPYVARIMAAQGYAEALLGENLQAQEFLVAALDLVSQQGSDALSQPFALGARHNLAVTLLRLGEQKRAIDELRRAVELGHPISAIRADAELLAISAAFEVD